MKKQLPAYLLSLLLALLLVVTGCGTKSTPATSRGMDLLNQAQSLQEQGDFTEAIGVYEQARAVLQEEGNDTQATECLNGMRDIQLIGLQYPYHEDEIKQMLAEAFPQVPEDERNAWIEQGKLESFIIDGEPRYFESVISNIKFRNVDLFRQDPKMYEDYSHGYGVLKAIIDAGPGPDPWQPFLRPISYTGNGTLAVPRDELPQDGILKIWFPIPILTGPQMKVNVVYVTPSNYVKDPPSIDQDIGLVYMEIPLEQLKQDLNVNIQFSFEHYEQRFQVDPLRVGEYDLESALYQQYTESYGNITITDEIRDTALRVVGNETNPYLAAKKIYDYVISNITYSFMPHLALWPRGEPESVYVHNNRCGDCGAQSMYFSALCRAVGIPTRTTGGWQLFSGNFSGHFWAEFYLPNYGWIPVDPTAAEVVDYLNDVSEQDKKTYQDFFFANQDHFRCNVQSDVDVPLIPPTSERVMLPLAIQMPAAACDTMEEDPGMVINNYWTLEAKVNWTSP
jgi:tetratricopeptide (TPR) repeat protein